jgi:hypothetical protein
MCFGLRKVKKHVVPNPFSLTVWAERYEALAGCVSLLAGLTQRRGLLDGFVLDGGLCIHPIPSLLCLIIRQFKKRGQLF